MILNILIHVKQTGGSLMNMFQFATHKEFLIEPLLIDNYPVERI